MIQELPDEAFDSRPEERKNSLENRLEALANQVEAGAYKGATSKLEKDVRGKMDGCLGGKASDDWIIDCEAQLKLNGKIDEISSNLLIVDEKCPETRQNILFQLPSLIIGFFLKFSPI
jgi:hypothetical protein